MGAETPIGIGHVKIPDREKNTFLKMVFLEPLDGIGKTVNPTKVKL